MLHSLTYCRECGVRIVIFSMLMCSLAADAASVYLCRSYGGGTFWSNKVCSEQKSVLLRIVSVPDGMPFDQQVRLGEQARAEGDRLAAPPVSTVVSTSSAAPSECQSLDEQIKALDAAARQPQSAQAQDRIASSKKQARDRQFQLKCR